MPALDRRTLLTLLTAPLAAGLPTVAQAGTLPPLVGALRTNWSRDPYALGSYATIARGARQRDTRSLAQPHGRVLFAGEATHPIYNATTHAAYETGESAAEALIETDHDRIAVIGAGISGLTAAAALAQDDREVTVIEARDRIGGRIWSVEALGARLDLGASWVHGTRDNPVAALARGLATVATDESYVLRGAGGRRIADADAPDWLDEVMSLQHTAGAAASELNLGAYVAQSARDYGGPEVILPGGYDRVLAGLIDAYDLWLSQPVVEVAQDAAGVTLTLENGETHAFDACVVTLPLGVLKAGSVRFSPPLPTDKQAAIDRLGVGLLDKLYLRFETAFWDEDVTWIGTPETGLPRGEFNQWMNLGPSLGAPILLAFNGGAPARRLARLDDAALVARALDVLQHVYG